MRRITSAVILLVMAIFASNAQTPAPIKWQISVKMTSADAGIVTFKARTQPGWHLYGFDLPKGGPKSTVIDMGASTGIKWVSDLKADREPVKVHDKMFGLNLTWWDSDIAFRRKFKVTDAANAKIAGQITYMGCNDETCAPPVTEKFSKPVKP